MTLANVLMQTFKRQAEIANEAWSKMRQGNYEWSESVRAFVLSVEAPFEVWKENFPQLGPNPVRQPAWVNFQWGLEPDHLPVNLNKRLEVNESLKNTTLARLGATSVEALPKVLVEATGLSTAKVTIESSTRALTPGQYVGFIESDRSSTPLIVVTLTVPEPPVQELPSSKRRGRRTH